jgi:hypothetical protein
VSTPEIPFRTPHEALLWTFGALRVRAAGLSSSTPSSAPARPCTPDDVVKVIDRLYRQRRFTLEQARIVRTWCETPSTPPRAHKDFSEWNKALEVLETPLRMKGIVR